jgi:hypothetical protein
MKIGVVFPQIEINDDPDTIARIATTAEELGYDHVIVYDHVLGAGTASRPDWTGPYTSASMFHEPFVHPADSHLARWYGGAGDRTCRSDRRRLVSLL